jgi:hypothetical protein
MLPGCGILSDRNIDKIHKSLTTFPNFNSPTLERRLMIGHSEDGWPPTKKDEVWFYLNFFTLEF